MTNCTQSCVNDYAHSGSCAQKPKIKRRGNFRYTYADVIMGRVPVPANGEPGKVLFTLLMVLGMVSCMATFNGMHHHNWDLIEFLTTNLWTYPLVFVVAFSVRITWGIWASGKIIDKFIAGRFTGIKKSIAMTFANVGVMCPVICALMTLLLNGPSTFLAAYATTLPLILPVALLVNFFVVGPAVKLLNANVLSSRYGFRVLGWFQRNVMPVVLFFNS